MNLEDDFTYVARKALKGLALSPGEAALRAGLTEQDVMAFIRGKFSAEVARKLAPELGLNAQALLRHPQYLPKALHLHTAVQLDIPFDDGQVNAWLVREDDVALLFDTGYSPASCREALAKIHPVPLDAVFVTHWHRDHVGGIEALRTSGVTIYGPAGIDGVTTIVAAGDSLRFGTLTVTAFDLAGHCDGALGYRIDGLTRPVCVIGDALFAGSIGGCATPELYQLALKHLRESVMSMPDRTLLLPGHGPATTVGEERVSNPFVASDVK